MARSQSPDLQEYFKEFEDIKSSIRENDGEDEETSKTPDEGELEAAWLKEAGYGFLVSKYQAGRELAEDEIHALTASLPQNHAAVVRKRVDTLNATLRRKQKYTTKIDVRNIFPQQRNSEPVVIHSEIVDEPEEVLKPVNRPTTLPRGMKLSSSNGDNNLWIRQKMEQLSLNSVDSSWSSAPKIVPPTSSSKHDGYNPNNDKSILSIPANVMRKDSHTHPELGLEDVFEDLHIRRYDSQGSDNSLTSPSRSRSSSCNTLDSLDSGLDSSASNLNKDQSSSHDSLDSSLKDSHGCNSLSLYKGSKVNDAKKLYFTTNEMPKISARSSEVSPRQSKKTLWRSKPVERPSPLLTGARKRKHERQVKTPRSPVSPRNEVIHPEFGNRQNRISKVQGPFNKNRGGYSMSGVTEEVQDNAQYGVEMLSLQQKETFNKRHSQLSPISDSDITFELSIEENGMHFGGQNRSRHNSPSGDNMPNFSLVQDKLGLTRIQDLSEADLVFVKEKSLLELTHMFDNHNISYGRRRSKKKYKEHGIFGVPLQVLLENDRKLVPDTKVPIVFTEIVKCLKKDGLDTEGILRIPGLLSRIKQLREELEEKFYQGTFIWSDDLTANDIAALLKQFLRELPVPLLTDEYIEAFAQVENLPDRIQQLHALNLLILLLPNVHRDTLYDLLEFLEEVINQSSVNRMSLSNVAMIMAPNLFMAPKAQSSNANKDKRSWELEVKMATGTSNIMRMLIKYRHILWMIPSYLIALVRRQYELEQLRRNKDKTRMKFLAKKDKTEVYKKPAIKHENDFQEGVVRIQAPHLTKSSTAVQLDENMTAGDIVSKFKVDQGSQSHDSRKVTVNQKSNQTQVFADPHNFQSAGDDTFLFEKGGNIGERCLPNDTNMMALYKVNPNAEWIIKGKS